MKLSSAVRGLLAGSVIVVAKCRELWEGLSVAAHRPAADDNDYFRGSYEFSCTATPVDILAVNGRRRRQRCLPPCVGAKQATEMQMLERTIVTRRRGVWSPEPASSHQAMAADIDGLAEEFIQRFRDQLRMQAEFEQEARPRSRLAPSLSAV